MGPPTTPGPHAPADACVRPLRAISAPLPDGSSQTRSHGPNEDLETRSLPGAHRGSRAHDPRDEAGYIPALEQLGYVHTVREPSFHEHRCLRLSYPRTNLHVFGPDCPETIRHRVFRDWLRAHPEDRIRYEDAKRAAVPGGGNVVDYNARKQQVIREIYDRAFRAAGML